MNNQIDLDSVFTYIGHMLFAGSIKKVNVVKGLVSADDVAFMRECDFGCDCCDKVIDRHCVYFLRVNETIDIFGKVYEEGKIYKIGSSCVTKFLGPKNLKVATGKVSDRLLPDGAILKGRRRKVKRGNEFNF